MMQAIYGTKMRQTQLFLTDGSRIPVTLVQVASMPVMQLKTKAKEGYDAVQLGFGQGKKKQTTKPIMGHIAKAKLNILPKRMVEIRVTDGSELPEVGSFVHLKDVLKAGDVIDVTGISKGKGFAGGVKRHQFKGGPRTHGQSDRERAPGSLGQTTTPGRVYKGKRMAGHMGQDTATITNLMVVAVQGDILYVRGLVPGSVNSMVKLIKKGESKKFISSLLAEEIGKEEAVGEVAVDAPVVEEEKVIAAPKTTDVASEIITETAEVKEEPKKEKDGGK